MTGADRTPIAPPFESPRVRLVADDVTGAADAAVPFVLAGGSAIVSIDPAFALPRLDDADRAAAVVAQVLAVSTNSRDLDADAARDAVRHGLALLESPFPSSSSATPAVHVKKIDSTLRGHVAAETLEALTAWRCKRAVVAPAFPEQGRTYADGRLRLHGGEPGPSASDLFLREAFSSVMTVSEPAARSAVLRELAQASSPQDRLALICDTTQPDTLDHIVNALWDQREDTLWVGSAGLARALARRLAIDADRAGHVAPAPPDDPRRRTSSSIGSRGVVLFIGSLHEKTMRQCAEVEAAGVTSVVITPEGQRQAEAALAAGRDVLVRLRDDPPASLAVIVKVLAALKPAGIVLSGGDSALRVCEAARVTAMRLLGEVETGVPWGTCVGGHLQGVPVVVKSGGFGQPDTLLRAARFLTGKENE